MNALPRCVVAGLCVLLLGSAPAAEWIVKFDTTVEKTTTSADGKNPPQVEQRHFTETLALHDDYLVVEDDQRRSIYDFPRFLFTAVTLKTETYARGSLYPHAAFMEHELINRNALGAGMRAAKITAAELQFDRFWNETSLHMESRTAPADAPTPKIETTAAGPATEFRYAGEVVARFVPSTRKLAPVLQHRFVNYLSYRCDLHPRIRLALTDTGLLPQELTLHGRNLNVATVITRRLLSAEETATDSRGIPAGFQPEPRVPDKQLLAVLVAVEDAAAGSARPTKDDAIQFADAAIAAGRPLDAVLALLEYGLTTGEQPVEEMRRHRDVFNRDPVCQTYFKAFPQSSKDAAERSLVINASLPRTGLKKAHMLDVQRANLLTAAGRPAEAVPLFQGVLLANPYHAGALHDLGMIYARNYEEFKAWRCWDAARRLYPQHAMLRGIAEFERDLKVRQPDFF